MKIGLKQIKLRENLIIIVVLIAAIVIVVAGFLLIKPLVIKVFETKDELESKKLIRDKISRQAENILELKQQQEDYNTYWNLIDQALIKSDEEIELIRALEDKAKSSEMEITIKPYTPPKKKKSPGSIAMKKENVSSSTTAGKRTYLAIALQGDYYDFLTYLYCLENMKFVFKIEALDIKSVERQLVSSSSKPSLKTIPAPSGQIQANVLISYQLQK
jgi:DNA-binding protein H-NS